MQGVLLIAAGAGLLWLSRAYGEQVAYFNDEQTKQLKRRGAPRWMWVLLRPRSAIPLVRLNNALSFVVAVGGVLNLFGVWKI